MADANSPLQLIKEKLPVSMSLGLWAFLITYLVSVPLGVAKAVREGSRFDTLTTFGVLLGYALAWDALGSEDQATKDLIRADVVTFVKELMTEGIIAMSRAVPVRYAWTFKFRLDE